MQGPQFLYFLQDKNGMFATFQGGFLQWTGTPTPLEFTPDGWQDLSIQEDMDAKFFGLNLTYGTPQNFVEDGAGILKTVFYNLGYNAQVTLLILEQQIYFSPTEYGYYYTQLSKCSIDLTQYSHSGEKVTVKMLEGDLKAMFHTNEATVYEIPITLDVAKAVYLDGLKLKQHANYLINEPLTDPTAPYNGNNLVGLIVTSTEQKTQLGTRDVIRQQIDQNAAIYASKNFLLPPMPIDTNLEISVDFGMFVTLADGVPPNPAVKYTLALRVFDANGNIVVLPGNPNLIFEVDGPGALYNHRIQVKATKTIPLKKGYSAYLWSGINFTNSSGGAGGLAVTYHYDTTTSTGLSTDSNVVINYFYVFPATKIYALDPLYILKWLVSKISGGKFTAQSDFLTALQTQPDSIYSLPYTLYTSGDGIRGLTGSVLKTSIDDFFKGLNSTYNLGLGIQNNVLRVEPKAFWMTSQTGVTDLGEGSAYDCTVWTDVLFNTINIGCPNQTYDEALGDINGKYEVNMTHYYGTPVMNVNIMLDLTTKARRDMYGAEYARINLDGKVTSDSKADNELFEINVLAANITLGGIITGPFGIPIVIPGLVGEKVWLLDRLINPYVTGLLDNTSAFNLKLTSKHCLYRHGNYIRSVLDRMDNQKVTFNTADKNTPMVTTYPNGKVVDERGSVEISQFDPQIFKPYIFSDTTPSPDALIQANAVKEYSFTYLNGSVTAKGFPLKIATAPVDNRAQALQLIAAPDVDMSQFVDIWQ